MTEEIQCKRFKFFCNHEGKCYGYCFLKDKLVDFNACKCPVVILYF